MNENNQWEVADPTVHRKPTSENNAKPRQSRNQGNRNYIRHIKSSESYYHSAKKFSKIGQQCLVNQDKILAKVVQLLNKGKPKKLKKHNMQFNNGDWGWVDNDHSNHQLQLFKILKS